MEKTEMALPVPARIFAVLIVALGLGVFAIAFRDTTAIRGTLFVAFLLMTCLAARLKVKLPGVTGNMSVNLPFILVAVAEMSMIEALLVGCLSNLAQCLPGAKQKFNAVQTAFNFSNMALAVGATRLIFASSAVSAYVSSNSLRLAIATAGFFLLNTVPVAIVIFLTEKNSITRTWLEISQLSYPYFLLSAGVAGGVLTLVARLGWQVPAVILVLMLGVFYSYRRYFSAPKLQADLPLGKIAPEGARPESKEMHA